MYFAAKAAAERQAKQRAERLREEGMVMGRKGERDRIVKVLAEQGMPLTPEQVKALDGDKG